MNCSVSEFYVLENDKKSNLLKYEELFMIRSNKLQLLLALLCFSLFAQANAFWGSNKKSESKNLKEYAAMVKFSKNQKRIAAGLALSCVVAGLVYFYFFKKKQEEVVQTKKVQDKQDKVVSANKAEKKSQRAGK
jgi:hypothetical protein